MNGISTIPTQFPRTVSSETGCTLRIAYLVSEYPALSHTFIAREISELEQNGHEVERISIRQPRNPAACRGEYEKEFQQTFYVIEQLSSRFPKAFFRLLRRNPRGLGKAALLAARIVRNVAHRPHAVAGWFAEAVVLLDWLQHRGIRHVHNHFGNAAGFVAMIAAETGDVDFSLSIHGPDIFSRVDTEMLALKAERARFTRCISHYSRSQLCLLTDRSAWDRFQIVRCGVDTNAYTPRPHREFNDALPQVLCVGRLVSAKGQHLLLEASARLIDEGFLHHLTFIGTGPDEDSLRQEIADRDLGAWVTCTGGLPSAEVKVWLERTDFFVLPSLAEGIPVALMEAMAMEIPVLSTPVAGITELIKAGKTGILVPPSSVDELTEGMRQFFQRPEIWQHRARSGRHTVLEQYNQAKNGRAMVKLFESKLIH